MLMRIASYVNRHHLALFALFFALGGTSFAAGTALVPRNSIGTKQVIDGSLQTSDLSKTAQRAPKGNRGLTGAPGAQGAQGPQKCRTPTQHNHAFSCGSLSTPPNHGWQSSASASRLHLLQLHPHQARSA